MQIKDWYQSFHSVGGEDANFQISDIDEAADTKYYGYIAPNGWLIMKEVTSAGTFRYIFGQAGYAAAWTGRVGLTYTYFYPLK